MYQIASKILEKILNQEGTIKGLIMQQKTGDKKLLMAMICESLKYRTVIEEIMEKSQIEKHLKLKRPLLILLIHDLLFGKLINSPQKQQILKHKSRLHAELVKMKVRRKAKSNEDLLPDDIRNAIVLPRYVRVNTLKTTVDETVEHFVASGYTTDKKFCKQDQHLPELLVLPPNSDLHKDPFLIEGKIVLQDKASCFPAFVLNPPKNSVVIDGCAAPGNKTSHLSAIMQNTGTIYAFDKDKKRLETLKTLTGRAGCTNIKPILGSFLEADPKQYKNVEYILLDPSCSGSGIVGRLDHLMPQDTLEQETVDQRLDSLAQFQKQALLHAMKFPNVKQIVYSTCSKHIEENEMVVKHCLENNPDFVIQEGAFKSWQTRGLDVIPEGRLIDCRQASHQNHSRD
ncbi:S-adenosyl-L-methionine-dependent methyltransferase [Gorgonomyces haynaldii]|nr:S-adenosyl-L-methionine-dependent methyltransferase [Gorgonomyces haynaldii]